MGEQQKMGGSGGPLGQLGQLAGMVPPQMLNKLPGGLGAILGATGNQNGGGSNQNSGNQHGGNSSSNIQSTGKHSTAEKLAKHALKAYMKKH